MGLVASAAAMTLGQSRGAAKLGAPLDLVFDVGLGRNVNVATACLDAQLTYGDAPVSASKTRLTPLTELGPTGMPQVRLQGPVVQEPVVRVVLSGGCVNKVTRQYTFLTDLAPSTPTAPPTAVPAPEAPKATLTSSATPVAEAPQSPVVPPSAAKAPALAQAPQVSPPPQAPVKALRPPAPTPRLQMEVLDAQPSSATGLRFSWELATQPSEQPTPRRAEAAALWRQLYQGPQELQKAFDRAGALEAEAHQLRAQTQQALAQAQQAQAQLAASQQDHFPAAWVYGLAGTSLTFFGMAIWGWSRPRKGQVTPQPAWLQPPLDEDQTTGGAVVAGVPVTAPTPNASPAEPPRTDAVATPLPWPQPTGSAELVVPPSASPEVTALPDVITAEPSGHQAPMAPEPMPSAVAPDRTSAATAATATNARRTLLLDDGGLSDLREQAEFFASIGEHAQAIQLFKAHIAAHAHHSPAASLELLQLYRTLGRAEDFRQLRAELMQHFNAEVPGFAEFDLPSKDLEAYPDTLRRIELAWPTAAAVPLLEALIYRDTELSAGGDRYALAAFEDLQLLLGIAQQSPSEDRPAEVSPGLQTDAPAPEPEAVSSKWRTPVRPQPAPAVQAHFPTEPVLLPPDEFLTMERPFGTPPRTAPEPSQPSELTERLRLGGDVDFDRPMLGDVLSPRISVQAKAEEARQEPYWTPEPEAALQPAAKQAAESAEDDLQAHRYVGKALDFDLGTDQFTIKK